MIPLENRTYLLKKLKEGMDIRNACDEAKISRPDLYKCYKALPDFKDKVMQTIKVAAQRKQKSEKMSARHSLRKNKEILRNQKASPLLNSAV
jgi:hypothetical protein